MVSGYSCDRFLASAWREAANVHMIDATSFNRVDLKHLRALMQNPDRHSVAFGAAVSLAVWFRERSDLASHHCC